MVRAIWNDTDLAESDNHARNENDATRQAG